nr:uncharacterized protein LOC125184593 [Anser cygnoides]
MLFLFLKLPSQALSPPPRYYSSSWSHNDQKTLQAATSNSFARPDGFSPTSLCISPPPPFPDSFLCDLEELSSLALTTAQSIAISPGNRIHQVKDDHIIPYTEVSLSSPTALPQPFLLSTSTSSSAGSSHDIIHKHTSNTTKPRKDKDLQGILGSSVIKAPRDLSNTTREGEHGGGGLCNIPLPHKGGSVSTALVETAENEEICAADLSVDLRFQSKPQEPDFSRGAQDTTELTKLYIEEDLRQDTLEFPVASTRDSIVSCEGCTSLNIDKVS